MSRLKKPSNADWVRTSAARTQLVREVGLLAWWLLTEAEKYEAGRLAHHSLRDGKRYVYRLEESRTTVWEGWKALRRAQGL